MSYSLVCPECGLQFDYDVSPVPGNSGSQNMVQLSLSFQNSQRAEGTNATNFIQFFVKEQSSLNIGFKENSEWNLQEIRDKNNATITTEGIQLTYAPINELSTVRDIFYLTCPKGHRRRYVLNIIRG